MRMHKVFRARWTRVVGAMAAGGLLASAIVGIAPLQADDIIGHTPPPATLTFACDDGVLVVPLNGATIAEVFLGRGLCEFILPFLQANPDGFFGSDVAPPALSPPAAHALPNALSSAAA